MKRATAIKHALKARGYHAHACQVRHTQPNPLPRVLLHLDDAQRAATEPWASGPPYRDGSLLCYRAAWLHVAGLE